MTDAVVVACCQLAPRIGEAEANRALAHEAVVDAAERGAQVVVLPELMNSGYVFGGRDEALALAEPLDGPSVSDWAALAREHELVVVGGVCEREGETLRNTAVIVDPSGLRAAYRKAHLWDREGHVFCAGDGPPPVVESLYGRIAVVVCYDLEFPEWMRLPALAGAELVCAPVNWPREPRPPGERPQEVVRVQASASVNRMFIAVADRVGRERGVDWVGGSVIVDPAGFPIAGPAGDEETVTVFAGCELAQSREKRISPHNDVLTDRRPELYAPIANIS
ncbi:MAG TPA: nitrilase family protein [Solirubrobacteraceae bacterium]|nr:nitrilase family protein [Solirubrobacteraceae bacterium]